MRLLTLSALTLAARLVAGQAPVTPPLPSEPTRDLDARAAGVMPKVVAWRRDRHERPELSYSEERTAGVGTGALK